MGIGRWVIIFGTFLNINYGGCSRRHDPDVSLDEGGLWNRFGITIQTPDHLHKAVLPNTRPKRPEKNYVSFGKPYTYELALTKSQKKRGDGDTDRSADGNRQDEEKISPDDVSIHHETRDLAEPPEKSSSSVWEQFLDIIKKDGLHNKIAALVAATPEPMRSSAELRKKLATFVIVAPKAEETSSEDYYKPPVTSTRKNMFFLFPTPRLDPRFLISHRRNLRDQINNFRENTDLSRDVNLPQTRKMMEFLSMTPQEGGHDRQILVDPQLDDYPTDYSIEQERMSPNMDYYASNSGLQKRSMDPEDLEVTDEPLAADDGTDMLSIGGKIITPDAVEEAKKKMIMYDQMEGIGNETTSQRLKSYILSLPRVDDYGDPIKWVKFGSNSTFDGLAKVTNPDDLNNRQYLIDGALYIPVKINQGKKTDAVTDKMPVQQSTLHQDAIQTMLRNIDINKTNDRDWLALETVMTKVGRSGFEKECDGSKCRARCQKMNCESMCYGDSCSAGCIGVSCTAYCKGSACLSMCIGEYCSTKCDGDKCDARCWGKDCEPTCKGYACSRTANIINGKNTIAWVFPESTDPAQKVLEEPDLVRRGLRKGIIQV